MISELIPGYTLQKTVYQSRQTLIMQALKNSDQSSVIIKTHNDDNPGDDELRKIKNEADILRSVQGKGTVTLLDTFEESRRFALILKDNSAESLNQYLSDKKLTLVEKLNLAVKITEALETIHRSDIIHKDLTLDNIIYNKRSAELNIIDFNISTRLQYQHIKLKATNIIEGTFQYLSPEQSGRMNRAIDYRTDFYSLGICFYKLFTGKLPFISEDPLELIHMQITIKPEELQDIEPSIPVIISRLVLKLLSKEPEERYQSASGLLYDLRKIITQETEYENKEFDLGEKDISPIFNVPQKLYGREEEIYQLQKCFNEDVKVILLSGVAGIGKTSVIHELHKVLTKEQGWFVEGKYEEFHRIVPYKGLIQAFEELINFILGESEEKLLFWHRVISGALGDLGGVLTDIIPNLELIIGKQIKPPVLHGQETINRFNTLIKKFLLALTGSGNKLLIFIDDLQWIDKSSLDLIDRLIRDDELKNLHFIGSYRSDEVDDTHLSARTVNELKNDNYIIKEIKLEKLSFDNIDNMISETLKRDDTEELSAVITSKTSGNPFFIHQIIHSLNKKGLIFFDNIQNRWDWDPGKVKTSEITENLLKYMMNCLEALPGNKLEILKAASIWGSRFDSDNTCLLADINADDIQKTLNTLQNENYICQISDKIYKFSHDKLQQSAYSLLSESEKEDFHYRAGKIMEETDNSTIYQITNQFNKGLTHIIRYEENIKLAFYNLESGIRARGSIACDIAAEYFRQGINLLPESKWDQYYNLSFRLFTGLAEVYFLLKRRAESGKIYNDIYEFCRDKEKAEICSYRVTHMMSVGFHKEALNYAFKGLKLCNIDFETDPEKTENAIAVETHKIRYSGSVNDIIGESPEIKDELMDIAMTFFPDTSMAGYLTNRPDLFTLAVLISINITIGYGKSDLTAVMIAWYSVYLAANRDYKESGIYGQLALSISKEYKYCRELSLIHNNLGACSYNWGAHMRGSIKLLKEGVIIGIESGDFIPALFCQSNLCIVKHASGDPLNDIIEECEKTVILAEKYGAIISSDFGILNRKMNLSLKNGEYLLDDTQFSADFMERTGSNNHLSFLKYFRFAVHFWFEEYDKAFNMAKEVEDALKFTPGYLIIPQFYFFYAIILCQKNSDTGDENLIRCLEYLKLCSDAVPQNFEHMLLLVEAEICRINGEKYEAVQLYEKALQSAVQQKFTHHAALCNYLLYKYYRDEKMINHGKHFLNKALYLFNSWGMKLYNKKYHHITVDDDVTGSTRTDVSVLDLQSLLKTSESISKEVVLSELLSKIMNILLENAGATGGVILLKDSDRWVVTAEAAEGEVICGTSADFTIYQKLPHSLINYVIRTENSFISDTGTSIQESSYGAYMKESGNKSLLIMPLHSQGEFKGVLLLENNMLKKAFTKKIEHLLHLLATPMIIAIENAGLYQDLEERVTARTQELKIAKEEAEELNRAKSDFLSCMSHELRTPLNAILGFAQIAESKSSDSKMKHYLHSIDISGKALLDLINDILDLSKIEAGKIIIDYDAVSLKSVLSNLKVLFEQEIAKKDLYLKIKLPENFPSAIIVDETRLRQILFNLISNAIKFTEIGGIDINVSFSSDSSISDTHINLQIEVKDSGAGIDEDQKESVFSAFTQHKGQKVSHYGGAGLGLTISRQLCQLMNGSLKLESTRGLGSNFIIGLNGIDTTSAEPSLMNKHLDINSIIFEKRTVLIADDTNCNREILSCYLEKFKFRLLQASNGTEALEIIKRETPDIILLDIKMPIMDGFELSQALKSDERYKNIVIIAVTALALKEDEIRIKKCYDGYLRKPLKQEELIKELMNFIPFTIEHETAETNTLFNTESLEEDIKGIHEMYELKEEIERALLTMDMAECEMLAEEITKIGEANNCPPLVDLASKINEAVLIFDIDEIKNRFTAVLNSLDK